MKRRDFIKNSAALSSIAFLPSCATSEVSNSGRLRTAHIGVGGMGMEDLKAIASHEMVDITALCDVDSNALEVAKKLHPNASIYDRVHS